MNKPIRKIGKTGIYVVQGDITRVPADAIMTAINSYGNWFGGIDYAIQKIAGDMYHAQATAEMPLKDGQVVIAKGNKSKHRGNFNDVVFVVDSLKQSLDKIIYKGLNASNKQGYQSIALPAIRTGVAAGFVEKTSEEAINKMGEGIARFMTNNSKSIKLENIQFVIHNDKEMQRLMEDRLACLFD
jgi:O-acetyl-ADP-ribose deacetylase (regulator of RNase III)